jgi:simple sugar transport system permease protein
MRRERMVRFALFLAAPVLAILLAIAVAALVLVASGADPVEVLEATLGYGSRPASLVATINKGMTYYLAGVAAAIGFRMLLFNIGIDGQYRIAVFFAAVVGGAVALPAPLHVALTIAVAVVCGAAWAAIAGALKAWRGVNEVISTIMLNGIATGIIAFLLNPARLAVQAPGSNNITTAPIPEPGRLPGFATDSGVIFGFLVVTIAVGVGYWVLLNRTVFGFELRASGRSLRAAAVSGVDARRMILVTMILSGAVAGLIGLPQLLGETYHYGLDFPAGFGLTGLAIALIGRNHPVGIAIGALLWAGMERSSQILDLVGVSKEIVTIMQGVIVLAIVVAYELVRRYSLHRQQAWVGEAEGTLAGAVT